MRYKFSTLSGSEYLIDTGARPRVTWKRHNLREGHEGIIGFDVNEGELYDWLDVHIGEPAALVIGPGPTDYIYTTRVDRIEALDYSEED